MNAKMAKSSGPSMINSLKKLLVAWALVACGTIASTGGVYVSEPNIRGTGYPGPWFTRLG
jgi:hypothetical protein